MAGHAVQVARRRAWTVAGASVSLLAACAWWCAAVVVKGTDSWAANLPHWVSVVHPPLLVASVVVGLAAPWLRLGAAARRWVVAGELALTVLVAWAGASVLLSQAFAV